MKDHIFHQTTPFKLIYLNIEEVLGTTFAVHVCKDYHDMAPDKCY